MSVVDEPVKLTPEGILAVVREFVDEEAFLCDFQGVTSINAPNIDRVITISAPDAESLSREFIRIRGAHNPTADELELDQEVRPCAWCRLAGDQAAEAIVRLQEADRG